MPATALSSAAVRPGFAARRAPRQGRSKTTVESIKQAALELIEAEGFASLGTVAIAARAGISVGSLYQYFPNREAILLAIYEQATGELVQAMKSDLPAILDAPLDDAVYRATAHMLKLYRKNQRILIELPRQMPELGLDTHPLSFDVLIHETLRLFLVHRSSGPTTSIDDKAFFIEHVLIGSIQRYLLRPPPGLSSSRFLQHVSAIVSSYIRSSVPAAPAARSAANSRAKRSRR